MDLIETEICTGPGATQAMAGQMFQKFANSQRTNPALEIAVNYQADPQMCGFTIIWLSEI